MEQFEFVSRYEALGIPLPDPKTMCGGQCEGTGVHPHFEPSLKLTGNAAAERIAWQEQHERSHTWRSAIRELWQHKELWFWKSVLRDIRNGSYFKCDGWHFIDCQDCKGSGKA